MNRLFLWIIAIGWLAILAAYVGLLLPMALHAL
jgi:hypothetical protein